MDKEYLENQKKNLLVQKDNAAAIFNQAVGAISLIDVLIEKLDNQDSLDLVKKMTGADYAELEKVSK